jgi:hypothetical protein
MDPGSIAIPIPGTVPPRREFLSRGRDRFHHSLIGDNGMTARPEPLWPGSDVIGLLETGGTSDAMGRPPGIRQGEDPRKAGGEGYTLFP